MWSGTKEDLESCESEQPGDSSHDLCLECVFSYSAGQRGYTKCRGLPSSAAPRWTVRPYIMWGYRESTTFRECLLTLFQCHNETGNIWTHLIGLVLFASLFVRDFVLSDQDWHHRLVTGAYLTASMLCMGSSAAFHLLGPVSRRAYDAALRCDVTGIAAVIAASFFVGLHYGYWCHPELGRIYLAIVGVLSLIGLAWPHVPILFHNFNLSVAFFACFVAFALVPLLHWVHIVGGLHSEQAELFFYKLLATFCLYAAGFVFYSTQFPERALGPRFDLVGHSHQIWHLGVLAGAAEFYVALRAYVAYRTAHACAAQ
uniref:Uncharacterized protein n=1 Tax=Cryptomonas curvata TaxID=233186 RepID=A0A7S0MC97_9CRYP|mmetsp:Transcript_34498/g.72420  ORF Transcript_34498/g.72420 Transcript_34498/m.72420 type:complete len:314 (+) Transcript_34498:130-1071(+)